MDKVIKEFHSPKDLVPIKSLCCKINHDKFEIKRFYSAKPLFDHLKDFITLTKDYSNVIFDHFWECKTQEIASKKLADSDFSITFEDVVTLIWLPLLDDVKNLSLQLKSSEIKLSMLNAVLKQIKNIEKDRFHKELQNFSIGCSEICNDIIPDVSWIDSVMHNIFTYWEMCEHSVHADVFLQYTEKLQLTGDFKIPHILSTGVSSCCL